jgi:vacuolar-type H+-ATPase subunit F/Vma7
MYQPLLPVVKPLIFEGKSGILTITHKYGDQARLYVREGIIEHGTTNRLEGKNAVATCLRWVNITTSFDEGQTEPFSTDSEIDTNDVLSFLEKSAKNIAVIQKRIRDDQAIFQIDSQKLNTATKLSADDLKIALLFDGKKTIEEILPLAGKSELAVLTHTCRLIMAGVAEQISAKDVLPEEKRTELLEAIENKLIDLVGPAGAILVEDALANIGTRTERLAAEDIEPLLREISSMLDEEEQGDFQAWAEKLAAENQ